MRIFQQNHSLFGHPAGKPIVRHAAHIGLPMILLPMVEQAMPKHGHENPTDVAIHDGQTDPALQHRFSKGRAKKPPIGHFLIQTRLGAPGRRMHSAPIAQYPTAKMQLRSEKIVEQLGILTRINAIRLDIGPHNSSNAGANRSGKRRQINFLQGSFIHHAV